MRNTGAIFQRLVNKACAKQIGHNMEAYVDNIMVKSKKAKDYTRDLNMVFGGTTEYKVNLNLEKCVFRVSVRKFLRFTMS